MKSRISPEIELVYEQLLWIERRRFRILENVSAHFGRPLVERILSADELLASPLRGEPEFHTLLDERDPNDFLSSLATAVEKNEAAVITRLRSHVSIYREHVDEQIIFGSRTAGQEAGRHFLARSPVVKPRPHPLSVPEAVQAIFEMNFTGLPEERNHFVVLRSQGGSTVHFSHSPHLESWKSVGADSRFLYELRCEWVKGILDIISPQIVHATAAAIEKGSEFGLEHFYFREQHAGP